MDCGRDPKDKNVARCVANYMRTHCSDPKTNDKKRTWAAFRWFHETKRKDIRHRQNKHYFIQCPLS